MTERERFEVWYADHRLSTLPENPKEWLESAWQAALAQQREPVDGFGGNLDEAFDAKPVDGKPVAWLKTMYSGTRSMLEVDHLCLSTSVLVYLAFTIPEGWMPIETAPKDGTSVDLWRDERLPNMRRVELNPFNVFYEPVLSGYTCVRDATHWMPLPVPPIAAVKEKPHG